MQIIFDNLDRIIGPPIFSLVFLAIGYTWMKMVRRGNVLTAFQRTMVKYATLFTIGMGYAIAWKEPLAETFRWPSIWIVFLILWGGLLAAGWWRQHQRSGKPAAPREP